MSDTRRHARTLYRGAVEALPMGMQRRWLFLRHRRRWLRLRNPRTFSEKVNWRIVHDRRPEIAVFGDKAASKAYAAARGVKVARTLWSGTDLQDIAEVWPYGDAQGWVLKPNFSSGDIVLGRGRPDAEQLREVTTGWLTADRSRVGEWAYGQADRILLLEKRLGPATEAMTDYKFYVFEGSVVTAYVSQILTKRVTGTRYYNPDGSPSAYYSPDVPRAPLSTLPRSWPAMVETAARLGQGLDFVRVDLYDVYGEVYFGEVTLYPGGGLAPACRRLDEELGRIWRLPTVT
jgi:hypothetical protein